MIETQKPLAYSVENRPIEGFFFGPPDSKAVDTLFIGVFHGDEPISGDLMHRWLQHLQQEIPQDTLSKSLLIVPVLNPDGLARQTRTNAHGVDLNRNFPTADWQEENQDTPYYSGSQGGSEPETQLVLRLLEMYKPQKIISVHSPYKVLNFDGPALPLAEAMSVECKYPVVESIGYPTPGSFGTYIGIERNIPVVTLELPEDETLDEIWTAMKKALHAAVLWDISKK